MTRLVTLRPFVLALFGAIVVAPVAAQGLLPTYPDPDPAAQAGPRERPSADAPEGTTTEAARPYGDILLFEDEAALDLRATPDVLEQLLRIDLGDALPRPLPADTWIVAGALWLRLEPLPFRTDPWTRVRLRLDPSRGVDTARAETLLSTLALRLADRIAAEQQEIDVDAVLDAAGVTLGDAALGDEAWVASAYGAGAAPDGAGAQDWVPFWSPTWGWWYVPADRVPDVLALLGGQPASDSYDAPPVTTQIVVVHDTPWQPWWGWGCGWHGSYGSLWGGSWSWGLLGKYGHYTTWSWATCDPWWWGWGCDPWWWDPWCDPWVDVHVDVDVVVHDDDEPDDPVPDDGDGAGDDGAGGLPGDQPQRGPFVVDARERKLLVDERRAGSAIPEGLGDSSGGPAARPIGDGTSDAVGDARAPESHRVAPPVAADVARDAPREPSRGPAVIDEPYVGRRPVTRPVAGTLPVSTPVRRQPVSIDGLGARPVVRSSVPMPSIVRRGPIGSVPAPLPPVARAPERWTPQPMPSQPASDRGRSEPAPPVRAPTFTPAPVRTPVFTPAPTPAPSVVSRPAPRSGVPSQPTPAPRTSRPSTPTPHATPTHGEPSRGASGPSSGSRASSPSKSPAPSASPSKASHASGASRGGSSSGGRGSSRDGGKGRKKDR